jgi:ATP-binding cassette, subfamily B, bacterial MsbA
LKRLFNHLKPYWKQLLVILTLLLLWTGLELLPPLFQRTIIDDIVQTGDTSRLVPLVSGLIGIYLALQLVSAGDLYLRHALGERFILDLRVELYAYLQRLSLSYFERTSTGELMSRITNDVNALEQFVTHGSSLTMVDLLRLLGTAGVLLWLDWQLALVAMLPVPVLAVALRLFNTRVRPIYRQVRDRLGDINARLQDNISGIQVIQAFGQERAALERFAEDSQAYYRARVQGIRAWSTFFPAIRFMAALGMALVLAFGARRVIDGALSLGTLVAFLSYVTSFYQPINRLTEVDNVFQQALAASERVFELLDQEPDIQDTPDASAPPAIQGEIAFEHVYFCYGQEAKEANAGDGEYVLHDVSFHVAPGQVVALVGPSGAGKTSIANLLNRFYDPIRGQVRIDGRDVKDIPLDCLRAHIAVVLQETFLFNSSVRDNLLFAKADASDKEMIAAARAAYAHDFIMDMPDGYDTEIGERGVRLSGGQRQRLALARAILADPRILILDEATSSVDAEAEYLIQQALEHVLKGRTALVIAHRLSTIRDADKIIALEEGHIREVGDHRELMSREGLYSQLYRRQLELATLDDAGEIPRQGSE